MSWLGVVGLPVKFVNTVADMTTCGSIINDCLSRAQLAFLANLTPPAMRGTTDYLTRQDNPTLAIGRVLDTHVLKSAVWSPREAVGLGGYEDIAPTVVRQVQSQWRDTRHRGPRRPHVAA